VFACQVCSIMRPDIYAQMSGSGSGSWARTVASYSAKDVQIMRGYSIADEHVSFSSTGCSPVVGTCLGVENRTLCLSDKGRDNKAGVMSAPWPGDPSERLSPYFNVGQRSESFHSLFQKWTRPQEGVQRERKQNPD